MALKSHHFSAASFLPPGMNRLYTSPMFEFMRQMDAHLAPMREFSRHLANIKLPVMPAVSLGSELTTALRATSANVAQLSRLVDEPLRAFRAHAERIRMPVLPKLSPLLDDRIFASFERATSVTAFVRSPQFLELNSALERFSRSANELAKSLGCFERIRNLTQDDIDRLAIEAVFNTLADRHARDVAELNAELALPVDHAADLFFVLVSGRWRDARKPKAYLAAATKLHHLRYQLRGQRAWLDFGASPALTARVLVTTGAEAVESAALVGELLNTVRASCSAEAFGRFCEWLQGCGDAADSRRKQRERLLAKVRARLH